MTAGISVSMDFICSPGAVWDVLASPILYPKWHSSGVQTEFLSDTDKLVLGSKLKLGDSETSVVTVFEPKTHFAVSTGTLHEDIAIAETEFGCRVSLSISGFSFCGDSPEEHCEQTITRLKETVYSNMKTADEKPRMLPRRKPRKRIQKILSRLIQGYSSPIEPKGTSVMDSVELSSMIDHSEIDSAIHLRAGLAAFVCAVLLFSTLSFTSTFERIDIVPSSGMSLTESIDVNKENASKIYIGQFQNDLELMLNCRGKRLTNTEFYYASTARGQNGNHVVQLIVSYDVYGKVRTVRFVDNIMANTPLDLPYAQLSSVVSAGMSPLETELAVGWPLSGFIKDIDGTTTVFFGVLERYDKMSGPTETSDAFYSGNLAELVITLNSALESVDAQYYYPFDPANPLPVFETTDKLRRQYNNYFDSYRADRAAYEIMFLLYSIPRTDADIILGAEPEVYEMAENGLTAYYTIYSRAVDEAVARYIYALEFGDNDVIRQVTMLNQYLVHRTQTLFDLANYSFTLNMTLYEAYEEIGIIPTYAVLNPATLTLCYGQRVGDTNNLRLDYELCLVLDASLLIVTEIAINGQIYK